MWVNVLFPKLQSLLPQTENDAGGRKQQRALHPNSWGPRDKVIRDPRLNPQGLEGHSLLFSFF